MQVKDKKENVICVFEENGKSIEEKIIEVFELYLNTNLQIKEN